MELEEIIKRVLRDEPLGPRELDALSSWLLSKQGKEDFFNILERYDGNSGGDDILDYDLILKRLRSRIQAKPAKKLQGVFWWGISAAVIVLSVLMGQVFYETRVERTILPGMNGAILTLADGSDILLEKELVGEIRQGGAMINIHGSIIGYRNDSANLGDQYNLLAVQKGGEYVLTLGDGTRVWMNADSRLKYPVCFNDTLREVFLEGEAYFEVAPDSCCPFLVKTAQQEIKVLGTKFNVSAYLDEPTVTTLLEGSVYLTSVVVKGEHQLVPGEQVVIDPVSNEFTVTEVEAENVIAWTLGKFVFDDNTLEQVMKKLERWYGVEVDYVDPEVKKIVFKGNLPRYLDLRILLGMIERISPARFQVDGYKVTVSLF